MQRLVVMLTLAIAAGAGCAGTRAAPAEEAGTRWIEVENRTSVDMLVWYHDGRRAGGRVRLGPLQPGETQVYEVPARATVGATDRNQRPVSGLIVRNAAAPR